MVITNLVTNMVLLALSGEIPKQPAGFKEWALQVMLTNVQPLSAEWHLDADLVKKDRVTAFEVVAYPNGFSASITFADRYEFGAAPASAIGFTDKAYAEKWVFSSPPPYWTSDTQADADKSYLAWLTALEDAHNKQRESVRRWVAATNLLTIKRAQQLAESAMSSFGVPVKDLVGFTRTKSEQVVWDDSYTWEIRSDPNFDPHQRGVVTAVQLSDGRYSVSRLKQRPEKYKLPLYRFRWETKDSKTRSTAKYGGRHAVCTVEVSGISGTIANFLYSGPGPAFEVPKDYLKALGLPQEAVFVRQKPGKPGVYEMWEP